MPLESWNPNAVMSRAGHRYGVPSMWICPTGTVIETTDSDANRAPLALFGQEIQPRFTAKKGNPDAKIS